jgi:hypothetical protein
MRLNKFVEVKLSVTGLHNWPNAIEGVGFLSHPHRHKFFFVVKIKVSDGDREVEFFLFQKTLERVISETFTRADSAVDYDFGSRSCEMIAEEVFNTLHGVCSVQSVWVYEDMENGGGVEYAE